MGRARASRRASSTRHRSRLAPTAGCMSPAASRASCIDSQMTESRSRSHQIWASRAGWRLVPTARCMSATERARFSRSTNTDARRHSRHCRQASPLSIWRSVPTAPCTSPARRSRRTMPYTASIRLEASAYGRRPSAVLRGLRSIGRARCSWLKRWPDQAGCTVCRRMVSPNSCWLDQDWSAWPSTETAASSSARTTTRIACRRKLRSRADVGRSKDRPYVRLAALRLISEAAPLVSVHEVDHEAERQPQREADPRDPRQSHHQVEARKNARDRHKRHPRCLERSRPRRLPLPQDEDADADEDEREQGADVREIHHLVDAREHRAYADQYAREDRRDVWRLESRVDAREAFREQPVAGHREKDSRLAELKHEQHGGVRHN